MNLAIQPSLAPPVWPGNERLRCVLRREETADTATFALAADSPRVFDYRPGQFVLVSVVIDGAAHQRAYSISSSPSRPGNLAITVRRVPGGRVSNWLLDNLHRGDELLVGAPAGEFHLNPLALPERVALFSGGCGITPMLSISRYLLDSRAGTPIHFIHSAASPEDLIFRDELLAMAAAHPEFRLELFLLEGAERSRHPARTGLLDAGQIAALLPDLNGVEAWSCGPQGYMDMVEDALRGQGLAASRFHRESFTGAAAPRIEPAAGGDLRHALRIPRFNAVAELAHGESLLDGLLRAGVPIVAACRAGVCGSCKCKVTHGEVERASTATLTEEDLAAGMVLACSTQARGDVEVDLG